jgi:acetyl-CoA carboxylase carboxyl transferase subunit beta
MAWFLRKDKGIQTPTEDKKDVPDGLWYKTPSGKIIHMRELKNNAYVCPDDDYHVRIGSKEYFEILFDNNKFTELDPKMSSADPLKFVDSKPYPSRIKASQQKTGLKDAVRCAHGKMNGLDLVVACMDFSFIGGSMGSVVGEKIARAIDHAIEHKKPLLIISKSGGARMMEAGILPYAACQNIIKAGHTFTKEGAVYLIDDRPDNRWCYSLICHVGRF